VPIMTNAFLVGLSRIDREKAVNMDLMTQRGWIDVPFLLVDGRAAKLTLEKGLPGERAMTDALK